MKSTESGIFFGNWLFSSVVEDDALTRSYKYRLLVAITLLTGLFMWMYSILSVVLVVDKRLASIGFTCAIVHAFCPMWYKITRSIAFATYVMVAAGMTFQTAFAYFTGGFFAPTLFWIAVLPMIVAILTNKTHALTWIFICVAGYALMFLAQTRGLVPPNQLSEDGKVVVQFMVGLGLIALVGGFSLFFVELGYFYHNKISAKNMQIRQLFRAITHDILNPLAVVEMTQSRIQNRVPELEAELSHSKKIIGNIRSTVENARHFDAADSGRVVLNILPVSMNGLLESVSALFAERFREKNLTLEISEDVKSAFVLGDEISLRTQVVCNAISNAIKFSNPGSKIEVTGVSHGTEYEVVIRDYGVGIQPDRISQWELAGALSSSPGTWGEKGTGFGLLLMKHYLDKAHGRLQIHSICDGLDSASRGTRVSLFLKKAPAIG
ncbi:sensor histidine kinase [Bdellovibrio sp. HCB288]|uniref:sensor histidine kinase n=1 Tax=Bdellovibrio sp. HCB288 TaxID=3394355 RepID=UPI0039B38AE4